LMAKYRTKPICMDTFVDTTWGGHRQMTPQEATDTFIAQFKLCQKLGFKIMRPTTGPVADSAPNMIERALPHAEQYDVRITPEIHAPIPLKGKYIDSYLELIAKCKTKYLGFTPDMGIFAKRIPRVLLGRFQRLGVRPELVQYIDKAYQDGLSLERRLAGAEKMGLSDADREFVMYSSAYGPIENDPKDLLKIMPYIYNIHGKFYEMTEDLNEYSIPYETIIPVLVQGGYDGYINSEFEGQRFTQDASETDSCEQIRRHHVMLKRLLGEA